MFKQTHTSKTPLGVCIRMFDADLRFANSGFLVGAGKLRIALEICPLSTQIGTSLAVWRTLKLVDSCESM